MGGLQGGLANPGYPSGGILDIITIKHALDMNLQDYFPNNSSIQSLDGFFHEVSKDSYYLNIQGVRAIEKTIQKNKNFLLLSVTPERSIKESTVRLLDVFYFKYHMYLLLIDLETEKVILISHYLDANDDFCNWRLLDFDFLKQRAEELI